MSIVNEIIGWVCTAAILTAYVLLNFSILSTHDLVYQLLNIIGAAGIVYHSLYKKDYEPAVLNIIWGIVALIAIINLIRI